jgi:endonuclease G
MKLLIIFPLLVALSVLAGPCENMVPLGTPKVDTTEKVVLLCRKMYAVGFSPTRHTAYWVVENLEKRNLIGDAIRKNNFKTDPDITTSARPSDYDNTGYDQGHLAPAGNMQINQEAMNQSFYLTNIIPQNPNNNQVGWKKLENYTRAVAQTFGNVYVFTGPIYKCSKCITIGSTKVMVPTHIFKIIYNPKLKQTLTFIVPNAPMDGKMSDYLTSVITVSKVTKINFFPNSTIRISDAKQLWPVNYEN